MAKKAKEFKGYLFEDNGHGDLYSAEADKFLIYRPYPMMVDTIIHKDDSVTMNRKKFKENTDKNKGVYEEGYEENDDGSVFVKAEDVDEKIKEESEDNKSTQYQQEEFQISERQRRAMELYEDGDISYEELANDYFEGDMEDAGQALYEIGSKRAEQEDKSTREKLGMDPDANYVNNSEKSNFYEKLNEEDKQKYDNYLKEGYSQSDIENTLMYKTREEEMREAGIDFQGDEVPRQEKWNSYFTLESQLGDMEAAQQYLDADDMTQYVKDEYYGHKIDNIKWVLDDDQSGHVEILTNEHLTEQEAKDLEDWIDGQNSDGLGEGFEQQDFANAYYNPDTGDGPYTYQEAEQAIADIVDSVDERDYIDYVQNDEMEAAIDTYIEDNDMVQQTKEENWDETMQNDLIQFQDTDGVVEAIEAVTQEEIPEDSQDDIYSYIEEMGIREEVAEEIWQNLASYEQEDFINGLEVGDIMRENAREEVYDDPESYLSDDAIYEAKTDYARDNYNIEIDDWGTMASMRRSVDGLQLETPKEMTAQEASENQINRLNEYEDAYDAYDKAMEKANSNDDIFKGYIPGLPTPDDERYLYGHNLADVVDAINKTYGIDDAKEAFIRIRDGKYSKEEIDNAIDFRDYDERRRDNFFGKDVPTFEEFRATLHGNDNPDLKYWKTEDGRVFTQGDTFEAKNASGYDIEDLQSDGYDIEKGDELEIVSQETDGYFNVKNLRTGEMLNGLSEDHIGQQIYSNPRSKEINLEELKTGVELNETNAKALKEYNEKLDKLNEDLYEEKITEKEHRSKVNDLKKEYNKSLTTNDDSYENVSSKSTETSNYKNYSADEQDILDRYTKDYGWDDNDGLKNLKSQIDHMKFGNETVNKTAQRLVQGGDFLIYNGDIEKYLDDRNIPHNEDNMFEVYTKVMADKIEKLYNSNDNLSRVSRNQTIYKSVDEAYAAYQNGEISFEEYQDRLRKIKRN